MKLFLSICICLLGCCTSRGQEQGDSLFLSERYFEAAVAYERSFFLSDDNLEKSSLLLKKSYCYKALGEYSEALEVLHRISRVKNDSLARLFTYEKVLLNYLLKDYQLAYNELLKSEVRYGAGTREQQVLKFLVLVGVEKVDEAKQFLVSHSSDFGLTKEEAVTFFDPKWKLKNPDKAYTLSLFLPGVGQMYAGHFFKGLISGGIQLGLVAFTAYHLWNGYFFTGGMTGAAFFYTFYLGGARYARQLAIQKNEELKEDVWVRFLSEIEGNKKP